MTYTSRNQTILNALKQERSPILPFEKMIADRTLRKLGIKQQQLGDTLGEAMTQSSETWHDNAPADAINAESKTIAARAMKTIGILTDAVVIEYDADEEDGATLGSLVNLSYGPGDTEEVFITGSMRELPEEIEASIEKNMLPDGELSIVTVGSPLGLAILGKKSGDTTNFTINDRNISVGVITVMQYKDLF